jgi:hypothetical protein
MTTEDLPQDSRKRNFINAIIILSIPFLVIMGMYDRGSIYIKVLCIIAMILWVKTVID